jgi:hypothetical protein
MQTPKLPNMHPMLALFVRVTLLVAIALVALFIAWYLVRLVVVAAIIAALIVGGFFLYNFFRRLRANPPALR